MRKILIVLFIAIVCALSCNDDDGWDEQSPMRPIDTTAKPDSIIVDTIKKV